MSYHSLDLKAADFVEATVVMTVHRMLADLHPIALGSEKNLLIREGNHNLSTYFPFVVVVVLLMRSLKPLQLIQ